MHSCYGQSRRTAFRGDHLYDRGKVGECVQASVMMDRRWRGRYTVGDKLAQQQIINLSLSFRRLSKPCVSVVGSQCNDFGVGGSSCF